MSETIVVVERMDYECNIIDYHYATPEEIKAFHGKCETCKYYEPDELYCNCPDNFICAPEPTDYCNHHEPKET